jgi:hypothetical protein
LKSVRRNPYFSPTSTKRQKENNSSGASSKLAPRSNNI